jgi:hypothetical protein
MQSIRSLRLTAATLVAVTGATALVLAATPAAQASGTTTLQDMQTGRCVDSNTTGTAYTLPCSGSGYQEWAPTEGTEESVRYVVLVDQASGRCLDSNANGAVYTLPCNGGAFQKWIPTPGAGSSAAPGERFIDDATGRCLDSSMPSDPSNTGDIYTLPCNGGPYQNWYVSGYWPECLYDCPTATTTTSTTPSSASSSTSSTSTAAVPTAPPSPCAQAGPAGASVTATVGRGARGRGAGAVSVAFGRSVTIAGSVALSGGSPAVDTTVCLRAAGRDGPLLGTATTDALGHYQFDWHPERSADVWVSAGAALSSSPRVTVVIRPRFTLSATPRALSNGQAMVLRGRVVADALPRGLVVALQARLGTRWETFLTADTGRRGRFVAHYRFTRTTGVQCYMFRARIAAQAGYPDAPVASQPVTVTVTG